jgi:anthranilate phosphoribosyltransferase
METCSICFLHAPLFHLAMKQVAPVRKALGVRTIFNILGPLLNPASVKRQMSGVFSYEIFKLYTEVLSSLSERSLVVYSLDGHDEVSLTSPCFTALVEAGRSEAVSYLEPGMYPYQGVSFSTVSPEMLRASETISEAVERMYRLLKGEASSELEKVVITNAAFAYTLQYPQVKLDSAMLLLEDVIRSGAAFDNTRKLIEMQG